MLGIKHYSDWEILYREPNRPIAFNTESLWKVKVKVAYTLSGRRTVHFT